MKKEKLLQGLLDATPGAIEWINEQLNGEMMIVVGNTPKTEGTGDTGGGNPNPGGPGH